MAGALVHEWIAQDGGSENVLQEMSETFPDADVLCLWNDSVGRFEDAHVRESVLARTPLRRHKAAALPLMPAVWRTFRDRGYDWALISSHAFAHHLRLRGAPSGFRRMVYVHTPARYVWTRSEDTRGNHPLARFVSHGLRPLDRRRARQGAEFAANSRYVRQRIQDTWGVDARVIHPPVRVERIQSVGDWRDHLDTTESDLVASLPEGFVLGASRFIPYKRLPDVIRVGELTGRPVVLAGHGPDLAELRATADRATVPVQVIVAPSSALLYALFQRTALYVFPAVEDFGIMPVEAMAAGAPVLAQARGGAAESVLTGRTGALVGFDSDDEIRAGVEIAIATRPEDRRARAREFGTGRFREELRTWVAAG
ncbi:glycosyltransferase [Pseudonocardia alni]|uniref:glycosyltransferase n=1 Tax=Pseudonocardia alni TaxID=33907 RepID=UPI00279DE667|nr:glycosyltransferase [Pseudonocardia alni]